MATTVRNYDRTMVVNGTTVNRQVYRNTSNSQKIPGTNRPDVSAQNAHAFINNRVSSFWIKPVNGQVWLPAFSNADALRPPGWSWSAMDNEALAKFDGKLKYGGASLGVTVASWKQSRDMIVNRCGQLTKKLDRVISKLERNRRKQRKLKSTKEPLAGQVLEGEFGWKPLIQDIQAAMGSAFEHAIPSTTCRARARRVIMQSSNTGGNPSRRMTWDGRAMVSISAKVEISNPNLWIANRLGLINLPGIIWDLIPWSFVVNMFTNMGYLVNSVTSQVGLKISNKSVTRSAEIGREEYVYSPGGQPGPGFARLISTSRDRTLGSFPTASLEYRIPDLNWELAAIAASLVVQRVRRLDNLIRVI